ncbi:MAG: DUF1700 domain-containing protein, partial [Alicyclobacillus macrosporangiidus]|uniref:HAAS domain-containing protein n=1 Tax=Alicyclobacillus macrosporangiidus TaxID=392015 RepID=UPI0026EFB815
LGLSFWAVWVSLAAATITLMLSPLVGIADVFYSGHLLPAKLFFTLMAMGIGMLLALSIRHLGKWMVIFTRQYWNWNVKLLKGGN